MADHKTWRNVVEKTRTKVMPPQGFPALSDAEIEAVTGFIEGAFERAEAAAPPDPGRVTARRLNRVEYDNSVRDLLGVDLRAADDFPQDDTGYGFDNNGDVLSLSPALMEKYVISAERVARAALRGPDAPAPGLVRLQSTRAKIEPSPLVQQDYDPTGLSLRNAVHAAHRFPVTAEYVVRVILGGERPAGSEPLEVGLFLDDREVGVQSSRPGGHGLLPLRPAGLFGQDPRVPSARCRGRSPPRGHDRADVRRTPGVLWRTEPVASPAPAAARVRAPEGRDPREDREAPSGVREAARGEGPRQRRAGHAAGSPRPLRAGARAVRGKPSEDLCVRPSRGAATASAARKRS